MAAQTLAFSISHSRHTLSLPSTKPRRYEFVGMLACDGKSSVPCKHLSGQICVNVIEALKFDGRPGSLKHTKSAGSDFWANTISRDQRNDSLTASLDIDGSFLDLGANRLGTDALAVATQRRSGQHYAAEGLQRRSRLEMDETAHGTVHKRACKVSVSLFSLWKLGFSFSCFCSLLFVASAVCVRNPFARMTMNMMQKASLAATFAKAQNQTKGQATFLGIKPPLEIEQLSVTLNATPMEKTAFKKVLAFVFEYMKGNDLNEEHWAQLKAAVNVDEIILSTVFSGALSLIRATTRSRTPLEVFSADCLDVLKIPKEFVVDMGLAIQNWYVQANRF